MCIVNAVVCVVMCVIITSVVVVIVVLCVIVCIVICVVVIVMCVVVIVSVIVAVVVVSGWAVIFRAPYNLRSVRCEVPKHTHRQLKGLRMDARICRIGGAFLSSIVE